MGASLTTPRRPKNSDPAATLHNLCDQCWLTTAFVEQHDSTIKAARFIENACDGPDHENSYDEYNESDHGDWNDGYLDRFESEDMNNKRLDHHETREKLCESSSTGCHLCSLLYDLIRQDESLREALDEGRPYVLLCKIFKSVKKGFQGAENMIRSGLGSISIMEAAPIDLGEPVMCTLDLYHYSAPIEDNIWPSNSSDISFLQATSWLKACRRNHTKCNRGFDSSGNFLPTRLVDVGPADGSKEPHLCETSGVTSADSIEYLTLSYCWGKSRTMTLTESNHQSLKKSIHMADLPLTLRDAVVITRKIGYRYIWIDSLCIIQDSPSDWKREAAAMSSVYSTSALTIAALWSPESDAGCFAYRHPLTTQPCRLCELSEGCVYTTAARDISRPDTECSVDSLRKNTPLLKRAWVLQERLLSRRLIYFGAKELSWECQELEANEELPLGRPKSLSTTTAILTDENMDPRDEYASSSPKDMWLLPRLDTATDKQITRNRFHLVWDDIITRYGGSRLTYSSDILVVLSGITNVLQKQSGLTFVEGVWKEFLPLDLLWKVNTMHGPVVKLPEYPSWSWACIRAANHLETSTKSPIANTKAHYSLVEPNPLRKAMTREALVITGVAGVPRNDDKHKGLQLQVSSTERQRKRTYIKLRAPVIHTTLIRTFKSAPRRVSSCEGVNYPPADEDELLEWLGEKPSTSTKPEEQTTKEAQEPEYSYAFTPFPVKLEQGWSNIVPDTVPPNERTTVTCAVLARDMDMELGDKPFAWYGSAGLILRRFEADGHDNDGLYERIGYWDYHYNKRRGESGDFKVRGVDYETLLIG